jgi:hypothetical protein
MIERGRDDQVQAMVVRWMRRVAGAGDSSGAQLRKDEIFPGRIPDPQQPQSGTADAEPPPPPPNPTFVLGPNLNTPPPPPPPDPSFQWGHAVAQGGTVIYGNPGFVPQFSPHHVATSDAAIAAAVETVQRASQVIEHDIDDLQPVLAFGENVDFLAVRGTATIQPQIAIAAAAEALEPNLVQLYARSNRYTDVRVAATFSIGTVGLWLGCDIPGAATVNGYAAEFDPSSNQAILYRVDGNAFTVLNNTLVFGAALVEFQRVGDTLSLRCGGTTITAHDSTYGAGYVGFGGRNAIDGDVCTGFEVTAPTIG